MKIFIIYILINFFIYGYCESCGSMPAPGGNLRRLEFTDEYCIDGTVSAGKKCKANTDKNGCEEVDATCNEMIANKCSLFIPSDPLKICDGTDSCTERLRTCAEMDATKCSLFTPSDTSKECKVDGNVCSEQAKSTCATTASGQCSSFIPSDPLKICDGTDTCAERLRTCAEMDATKCSLFTPSDPLKICDGTDTCAERLRTCAEMDLTNCSLFTPSDTSKECKGDQKNPCEEVHKEEASSNKLEFSKFLSLLLLFL